MALGAGDVENRSRERGDHDPESEPGEDEDEVGLPQRSQVVGQLVCLPAREKEKTHGRGGEAQPCRPAASQARSQQATRGRPDRDRDHEPGQQQGRAKLVEVEHAAA